MGWTYREIAQAWIDRDIDDREVLRHFESGQPDDTPMQLLVWVIRWQMTGYGGGLLDAMAELEGWPGPSWFDAAGRVQPPPPRDPYQFGLPA